MVLVFGCLGVWGFLGFRFWGLQVLGFRVWVFAEKCLLNRMCRFCRSSKSWKFARVPGRIADRKKLQACKTEYYPRHYTPKP